MKKRIALLGAGTVGSGVYRLIEENGALMAENHGVDIEVAKILVRDLNKEHPGVPRELLTDDIEAILSDASIVLVAEAMGGTEPALDYALRTLAAKKCFVTANKELISKHFELLERTARDNNVGMYFEPSVAGAIPVIKALTDSLAANRILSLMGIINGTTNYILSKMSQEGLDFEVALAQAQALGYAEPDPTNDVEGYDARFKLAILASLAFKCRVFVDDVLCEGISTITAEDMSIARDLGYSIKLLAIGKMEGETVQVRVHPTMIPLAHPLSSVNGPFNAVFINASAAGEMMFYGRGAGDMPTASAMVGDILHALMQTSRRRYNWAWEDARPANVATDWQSAFFIHTSAVDEPRVLGRVAGILGDFDVSIEAVMQRGNAGPDGRVPVVFITHATSEKACMNAIEEIKKLKIIRVVSIIRVEK
jgi:homoserine dehydrogenase